MVRNKGKRAAMEVAQLYVRDLKSSVATPVKQLYAFHKAAIGPDKEQHFALRLPIAELFLHDRNMRRVVEPGQFELLVGASSADIRLRDTLTVCPSPNRSLSTVRPQRLKQTPKAHRKPRPPQVKPSALQALCATFRPFR